MEMGHGPPLLPSPRVWQDYNINLYQTTTIILVDKNDEHYLFNSFYQWKFVDCK
jgi:hypothetical protein